MYITFVFFKSTKQNCFSFRFCYLCSYVFFFGFPFKFIYFLLGLICSTFLFLVLQILIYMTCVFLISPHQRIFTNCVLFLFLSVLSTCFEWNKGRREKIDLELWIGRY
ncbi:hypothetical protein I3760_13G174700 [Carya illinoinensis]|nr:hypothetical protein I3760_13G174700 [Carya illinoinensis]